MKPKPNMIELARAVKAPASQPAARASEAGHSTPTTLNLPDRLLLLLNKAAVTRAAQARARNAQRAPGSRESTRYSVSAVVVEILDKHQAEIERIANGED